MELDASPDEIPPVWHTLPVDAVVSHLRSAAERLADLPFVGHGVEAIAAIVLFALMLSFVEEYRAERAIEELRRMPHPLQR